MLLTHKDALECYEYSYVDDLVLDYGIPVR